MDDKVIEELTAVLHKHSPNFLVDSDGGIIHHDMKTGRIHMVEVRAFDVTEVAHAERPALREYDPLDGIRERVRLFYSVSGYTAQSGLPGGILNVGSGA